LAAAEHAAERLGKLPKLRQCELRVAAFANANFDAVAAGNQPGIADARLPQHPPHVIEQSLDFFLADGIGIDLEQEMRTALKIEPQHDVALGPGWPAMHHADGEEIVDCVQVGEGRCMLDYVRILEEGTSTEYSCT